MDMTSNTDILLDSNGDLVISDLGDIIIAQSVAQRINIKIKWLAGEWRWDEDEGLPYLTDLFSAKIPDTDRFEMLIRETIFDIEGVTAVEDVRVTYDRDTRKGTIRYTAKAGIETIKEEVEI